MATVREEAEREHAAIEEPIGEFHRDFRIVKKLGAGSFGAVYSACRVGGCSDEVAVKVVDSRAEDPSGERIQRTDRRRQRAIANEVEMLRSLPQSACVIEFHGFYQAEGLAYMVIEKCSMGLLPHFHGLPSLTEGTLKPVFRDMMTGIAACHAAGIVHRDVKCDNFLVARREDGCVVKLCDFGLAGRVSAPGASELSGSCGTPPFMAPEILDGEMYGAKVDVWAMGVLAYVLLFGAWPYMPKTMSGPAMKAAIRSNSPAPSFRSKAGLPEVGRAASWARALLHREPTRRPSAQQALSHRSFEAPWDSAAPMAATLRAAVRVGAFELPGRATEPRPDEVLRMNAKRHPSEVSTVASAGPSRRG